MTQTGRHELVDVETGRCIIRGTFEQVQNHMLRDAMTMVLHHKTAEEYRKDLAEQRARSANEQEPPRDNGGEHPAEHLDGEPSCNCDSCHEARLVGLAGALPALTVANVGRINFNHQQWLEDTQGT